MRSLLPVLLIAGAAALWIACAAPESLNADEAAAKGDGASRKPNFIIILVDDLGWADVGCFGSTYYETPNIDLLAAGGMRFTDAYAACAVCSPTRASILTGRYPARIGITDWIRARFQGGKIPEDRKAPDNWTGRKNQKVQCPANALWMEHSEYTIAEALKEAGYVSCHIGKWHLGADDWYPEKQGFDINIGGCDYGQPPSYFDPYKGRQGDIPTLKPRREGEYLTDREADEAVKFIREHRDRPFFLYLANYAVHTPIQAKEDLKAKYEKKEKTHQKNAAYAAMIESVDDAVSRVMEVLDECGLEEKTMIVFFSDNGGLAGVTSNAPLRSGKGYPYEGGIRVPCIVRWPDKVLPQSMSRTPISSVDFFPTICEAAGVKPHPDRRVDGMSLAPLFASAESLPREALFWHFPHYRGKNTPPYSIIRARNWKLIKRYDGGKEYELFDLKSDPGETADLSAQQPDKVMELDAKLKAWLEDVGAKVPRPNPEYDPDWKPGKKK